MSTSALQILDLTMDVVAQISRLIPLSQNAEHSQTHVVGRLINSTISIAHASVHAIVGAAVHHELNMMNDQAPAPVAEATAAAAAPIVVAPLPAAAPLPEAAPLAAEAAFNQEEEEDDDDDDDNDVPFDIFQSDDDEDGIENDEDAEDMNIGSRSMVARFFDALNLPVSPVSFIP